MGALAPRRWERISDKAVVQGPLLTTRPYGRAVKWTESTVTLGCPPESRAVGSIKMSGKPPQAPPAHPIGGQSYHLAVSTHEDEELLLAKASKETLGATSRAYPGIHREVHLLLSLNSLGSASHCAANNGQLMTASSLYC